ncbi:MAG: DUF4105 domain-containing protein [Deltaproteobacteria bacterium]|nr:DUF4105 domain-containing protein [Deltaproteobacteria bacterium]MBW2395723.1 DUF4105 domain-containing protein [Deltaproteobacteria bacterium]
MSWRASLVLFLALALPAASTAGATRLGEALVKAEALGLARHATWEALLHVVPGVFGLRRHSEIPQSAFFLASDGAAHPERELEVTLRALFEVTPAGDQAAHCRFPARAAWLGQQLGLPAEVSAQASCPALTEWQEGLAPRGITLIAPEAFMNNPASMFGHTLLRLDVADPSAPQNLLAYAIDFMAMSEEETGVMFSLKGTFGFYDGFFGLNPFYEKLERYADWENRDIWEYPLDLRNEQVEFILLHLWELSEIGIPYYFFRQNCSYQLIRLLAVAIPGLDFSHGIARVIAPVDTVRDVLDRVGLLGEVRYRPSPATELRTALRALPPDHRQLALDLYSAAIEPDDPRIEALDSEERGAVLEAAYRSLRYRYAKGDSTEEEARERAHTLLAARSRAARGATPPAPRPAVRPDQGHGTALLALAGGVEDGAGFVEFRLRPGFHGRLDPSGGFPADSTVGVFDTRVRWFPSENKLRLEEVVLLELHSNTPRDSFFKPATWGFETGLRTRLFPEDDGDLDRGHVWRTKGSAGFSFEPVGGRLLVQGLVDLGLEVGSGFDHGWAFGPGVVLGMEFASADDRWKTMLQTRATRFVAGDTKTHLQADLGLRRTLTRTTAALVELEGHYYDSESWLEARLSLQWTF